MVVTFESPTPHPPSNSTSSVTHPPYLILAGTGQKLTYVGPNVQGKPGVEASLDVQYIMALGGKVVRTACFTWGYTLPRGCLFMLAASGIDEGHVTCNS